MNQPAHLLDGYKVLDFTQFVAGPKKVESVAHDAKLQRLGPPVERRQSVRRLGGNRAKLL
jgi:hypothetical protein